METADILYRMLYLEYGVMEDPQLISIDKDRGIEKGLNLLVESCAGFATLSGEVNFSCSHL